MGSNNSKVKISYNDGTNLIYNVDPSELDLIYSMNEVSYFFHESHICKVYDTGNMVNIPLYGTRESDILHTFEDRVNTDTVYRNSYFVNNNSYDYEIFIYS